MLEARLENFGEAALKTLESRRLASGGHARCYHCMQGFTEGCGEGVKGYRLLEVGF